MNTEAGNTVPQGAAPVADMQADQIPAAPRPDNDNGEAVQTMPQAYAWSFYQLCLLQIPKRTGLNNNHILVIKTVRDWKSGVIDSQTMGRMLRLSPHLMAAALEISRNLDPSAIGVDGFLAKRLLQVKYDCYEAVTIAETKAPQSITVMKFPPEIRKMIYTEYLTCTIHEEKPRFLQYTCESDCMCGSPAKHMRRWHPINLALAFTSKQVSAEVLSLFFRLGTMSFACPCELLRIATANKRLRTNARSVTVRWCGPKSDKAFALLGTFRRLKRLGVVISQSTTEYPTRREAMMRAVSLSRQIRLCDALGIDELLRLRGLSEVGAVHVHPFWDARRSETERMRLETLMRRECLEPAALADWDSDDSDGDTIIDEEEDSSGSDTDSMISELSSEAAQAFEDAEV